MADDPRGTGNPLKSNTGTTNTGTRTWSQTFGQAAISTYDRPSRHSPLVPSLAPPVTIPPPPIPGTPEAVRAEAVEVGKKWGELLASWDTQLSILQDPKYSPSMWERMRDEQKRQMVANFEIQVMRLPALSPCDTSEFIAAQDEGFKSGMQAGYSLEKFNSFLINLGFELSIQLIVGMAARGVRLPRFITRMAQAVLPTPVNPAKTAAEVRLLIARVRLDNRRVVYNVGGRGAPGEPVGAININPESFREPFHNQVLVRGEEMDRLLPPGSGDEVWSRNLVGPIEWEEVARAAKVVVKPGGSVTLGPWAAQRSELPRIRKAMENAGFRNVRLEYGVAVKGER